MSWSFQEKSLKAQAILSEDYVGTVRQRDSVTKKMAYTTSRNTSKLVNSPMQTQQKLSKPIER